jgi:hypothetical protein
VENKIKMKPRIYIDTSIVGGFFDKEFSVATQALFERLKNGEVALTQECIDLANQYVAEKVVGGASIDDCYHIAIATIAKVDVLASWNFKHIVNLDRIKGYNGVNLKMGYSIVEIRNPKDLISYGND